jgi:hypothetical protein
MPRNKARRVGVVGVLGMRFAPVRAAVPIGPVQLRYYAIAA